MSEYWKSTPKYWCKHCKIFVRDTKLETANHNASPKHQGNLKRFLRDLQRNHDKNEKDKERAKLEVARLNDIVPGKRSPVNPSLENGGQLQSHYSKSRTADKSVVSESQRKQNLAQLAEMGINIPSELRPNIAMPGEWQVVSEHIIDPIKIEASLNVTALSTQKRGFDVGEEKEDEMEKEFVSKRKKSHWKSAEEDNDKELDSLLTTATQFKRQYIKSEIATEIPIDNTKICQKEKQDDHVSIKSEPYKDSKILPQFPNDDIPERSEPTNKLFAKRKAKNIRRK